MKNHKFFFSAIAVLIVLGLFFAFFFGFAPHTFAKGHEQTASNWPRAHEQLAMHSGVWNMHSESWHKSIASPKVHLENV